MTLSAITAVAENHVIGKDNALPWRLPADMRFFKNTTWGHPVIMGRKTYESFDNHALPGRTNIIITRQPDFRADDARIVHSVEEAVGEAKSLDADEVFILGGAEIYRQSLPLLDRIYLTRIYAEFEGDAFFPELDTHAWHMVKEEKHTPDEKNKYSYAFQVWERM
ncbi:dihydrofolate reductase [Compostibacter hankyongensis]|uniref:Dihydrofolate reductase n=1 Tax=Compostibacter hankyongensis TaxID=1007089 RepID=A0ABP8FZ02_9BACT